MTENLKDILSHLNKNISQETLLKYLNGQLDAKELHEVEQQLLEDPFDNDAAEGLQGIADTQRILLITDALNRDLKKKTLKKKAFREKQLIRPQWWLYFSILILLLLLAMIYIYIRRTS